MTELLTITPHEKDLGGGFIVRRLLPAAAKRAVGPFIFFDHFGPVAHTPSDNFDVRPHPHIGLATVTYLFEGAMMHRDSLGYTQRIEPGAINWMTAGSGIVHSERAPEDLRDTTYPMHGLQLWVGLPLLDEECTASFSHTPASAIPEWHQPALVARVLIGSAFGLQSPVKTLSKMLYLDIDAQAGARFELPLDNLELALYCVSGALTIDGVAIAPQQLIVLNAQERVTIASTDGARFVVLGGEPLEGYRHMWWNFVSSSKERIEQAKANWRAQSMGAVPGETEFIPLPE
jgi:redox-sensitive bicupin YhaK (pirin superfamily)